MTLNSRQSQIFEKVKQNKKVFVKSLAEELNVSEMTIRRDLIAMQNAGYIQRFHGGALLMFNGQPLPIEARMELMADQKAELSQRTRKFLFNGASVFIDASSTCSYIIPVLGEFKGIKIITNSVQNLLQASKYHIPCILAGGEYYERDMCTSGSFTEDFLRNINVDIGFFSALGITENGIITDDDEKQTATRKTIMRNCDKIFFLMDKSKLNKIYTFTLCKKENVTEVIII